ncbi:hypothetical protein ACFO4E_00865 [Nocardiopsis mangrovi]|uniref:Uncharacterized protein n=1 Tax=Nocardiopsis mangrovi TaxID=1179818 RepID=A0ABV9DS26_9ACTN
MMTVNIQQVSMSELRVWAGERAAEIVEINSRDLAGNRIFTASDGDESRVATVPPDEPVTVREAWDARLYDALSRMSDVQLRNYVWQRLTYGYTGPQT